MIRVCLYISKAIATHGHGQLTGMFAGCFADPAKFELTLREKRTERMCVK
jgi:hypothetical protein